MKRIFPALCALLLLTACGPDLPPEDSERPQIVATVFPAYDFARSAAGELADVTLLLPPGAESHSYEPTPADILRVQRCDLFIYLGGESDAWVDTILSAIEPRGDVLRMIDCVDLLEEETVEGMQGGHDHDHEEGHDHLGEVLSMDEHVWTAPRNAAAVTRIIGQRLALLDRSNGEAYAAGAEAYALELEELDRDFAAFFDTLPDRTIVFGDRFPLLYFAEAYDLDYYAAFPGCGAQTEPSAATVAFLTRKVREEGLPAVWYIEFSNHLVADSIAEAAGVETAQFHTCHNVSRADLEAGATCLSLMRANLEALREHM
ncbi:metal ABC transporter substrate-binding protein [uncultured Oscillibacter sp.]|uniref:metal ABC transporter substrate-binding protein n=1 Tax=uncultured Oscillibacter sp. TaxID=876091 RepID=UPI0026070997|nr:metal ABC transporter substrate-binding protein [uncultured Oscillibacter sp.]